MPARVLVALAAVVTASAVWGAAAQSPPPPASTAPPGGVSVQSVPQQLGPSTPATSSSGRAVAVETFKGGSQQPRTTIPYSIGLPPVAAPGQ